MLPVSRQGWFLIEFLKWYFSKYWQVRTRWVFAQTVTYVLFVHNVIILQTIAWLQKIHAFILPVKLSIARKIAL